METRVYHTSAPVWVTVDDDGTVTVEVDLSDLADRHLTDHEPQDQDGNPWDVHVDVIASDQDRITLWLARDNNHVLRNRTDTEGESL